MRFSEPKALNETALAAGIAAAENVGQADASDGFSAVLTPYRSLSPRGFTLLMVAIGGVSFAAGAAFLMMGAWPVFGFFGLDVLLIYAAFRINYRAARLYERIELTENELTITRVLPSGRSRSWSFNPYWARLNVEYDRKKGAVLSLSSHGRKVVFGSFLSEAEKLEFADALSGELNGVRHA